MKLLNKLSHCVLAIVLCLVSALNIVLVKPYINNVEKQRVEYSQSDNVDKETKYNVKVYGEELIQEQEKHDAVLESASVQQTQDEVTDEEMINFYIQKMIYNLVAYSLNEIDLDVFESIALNLTNDTTVFGLTYTAYEDVKDYYKLAGFVCINNENFVLDESDSLVSLNNTEQDGNKYIICDMGVELLNDHFIYYDKYVKYYWVNSRTIHYEIKDNVADNYDKSFGLLFSYDTCKYVYDNDFTYTSVEVQTMFTGIDFDHLQQQIDAINKEQEANGYYVSEITITVIDYKLIQEWEQLSSTDSFYGYDLESLNQTFGASTTLEFTADGQVKQAELIQTKTTNWLKVGLMVGIGLAAILIGAALAPLTGGCSFGASLLCITKMTAVAVVSDLVVQTVINTISGVVQGKSFVDALKGAVSTTLTPENIAKTFMTSAIMSAVMVGSGLVKACFVEDTMVSTPDGLKPIQDIAVGDSVYSFDEATGVVGCVAVTEIMRNTSRDVCTVALDTGESITSTSLHPWYVQGKGWTPAYALASGDILLTDEDEFVTISAVRRRSLSDPVDVYNMTVGDAEDDQYHTYFVGEDSVLVHNACKPTNKEVKNARQKAVREAWKKEQKAVLNGKSKYNWTIEQVDQIKKFGKVKGFQGCHLIDVSKSSGNLKLIGNPDNIVFLERSKHLFVHGGSWKNATDILKVKKFLPWVMERLSLLGL